MNAVFLRADGRKELGMGHLARSLTLARELTDAWSVEARLVVREDPAARRFLAARRVSPLWLDADRSAAAEVRRLCRLADRHPGALFVFDQLDPAGCEGTLRRLHEHGAFTMVVCDTAEVPATPAGALVSGHLEAPPVADPRYMLGPRYFMLDPRLATAETPPPSGRIRHLAVTLGGSDHEDLTGRALRALSRVAPGLRVELAVSRASGTVEALHALAPDLNLDLAINVDPAGLVEFWSRADAALTAGGNSLFERVACRLPGATLCQTPLQMEHAGAMAARGVCTHLGLGSECGDPELRRGLAGFLNATAEHRTQYRNAPGVVDTRGTIRVREGLEALGLGPRRDLATTPAAREIR